jgi:hypothetical protein
MLVQFLCNGIKLVEIVLRLVLLVTVLKIARRCLLEHQGAFYICGLKAGGNKTNVRQHTELKVVEINILLVTFQDFMVQRQR